MEKLTKQEYREAQNKSTRKLMAKKRSNQKALLVAQERDFPEKKTLIFKDSTGRKYSESAIVLTRKDSGKHQKHSFAPKPLLFEVRDIKPYERNVSSTAFIPGIYEPSIAYEIEDTEDSGNYKTCIIPAVVRNEARLPANANFSYVRGERVIWDL